MASFHQLLIYLHQTFMGLHVVNSEYVSDDRKSRGSGREAGRPTVLNIIRYQDENHYEEQQTFEIPVQVGSDCGKE